MALSICGLHSMDCFGKGGEMFEGFRDVSWHGNFDIFLVVIPFNGQSTVVIPFKFHVDFVMIENSVQDMISIVIVKSFDTKRINSRGKKYPLHVARGL